MTMTPSFTAHIRCPFCRWGALATASSYCEAQGTVARVLVEHVGGQHAPEAAPAQKTPMLKCT